MRGSLVTQYVPAWVLFTVASSLCFVTTQTLLKKAFIGQPGLLVLTYAFGAGMIAMAILHLVYSKDKSFTQLPPRTMIFAILLGVVLALGNFFINRVFAAGGLQTRFTVINVPTVLMLGMVLGVVLSGEKLGHRQLIALPFIFGGLILYLL